MTRILRPITHVLRGSATSDGAGVRLTRTIGSPPLAQLDPFLLLDEFRSDDAADYIGGFPNHPHRGFETVTYMLAGRMRHGDNKGNTGLLTPGSVQWMTAGRGIIHSEMPEQENGLMWGFQLWVNLPAAEKMTAPRYQDIAPERIPVVAGPDGVTVKVVAGRYGDAIGPVDAHHVDATYLDVAIPDGGAFRHDLPHGHSAFIYPFEGAVRSGGERVARGEAGIYGAGDAVEISAENGPARVLLIAGRPLREPVARYGPFVMTTEAEIRQAFTDYEAGRF